MPVLDSTDLAAIAAAILATPANKLATSAGGGVTLADGVAHGGSGATFWFSEGIINNPAGIGLFLGGLDVGLQLSTFGTGAAVGISAGVGDGILFSVGGFAFTGGDIDANLVRKVLGGGSAATTGVGVQSDLREINGAPAQVATNVPASERKLVIDQHSTVSGN